FEDGTLPEGLTYVWSLDSSYGYMKATGYNKASYAVDAAYLVSPEIDLTGKTSATMTYRQAIGQYKINGVNSYPPAGYISYAIREVGGAWSTPVDIDASGLTYPSGKNFTSFGDGAPIDLTPYAGKKVQVGFRYHSTAELCGTWEIDNVVVTAQ
ncbi:MAG: choice-of-anchor J domain-containing protein, partial [Muribaculaceae bacterium]|nr:choice-of-anchor J domain-containing protein [Muribaculaceae bacterium]